ncbi:MAG TPA: ATP-binding protein, partial [Planctomycetaceae bacterium]|nr:ATP-binding protein [Planctomycetaceae bacterium]
LSGAVIVCTPQEVALLDAVRALNMFRELKVPVLGIIENMSGFVCPHCGQRSEIFGCGGARKKAQELGVPFLGEIPILLEVRRLGDSGRLVENLAAESPVRTYVLEICDRLVEQLGSATVAEQQLPTLE